MQYIENITIKAWKEEDRPREKLLLQGRRVLSDAELIAILIGSGSRDESAVDLSKRILYAHGNDLNQLAKSSVQELAKFKGIGEAKAITIIAALELGRRRKEAESVTRPKVSSSKQVFELLYPYFADLHHEEFWIVLLSRNNEVLSRHLISKGGQAATIVDPKIVFNIALQHHAASIMLAHNHPSGNLQPSQADIMLTKKLRNCAEMLDISVLDHLIFAEKKYYSFADEGML